MPRRTSHAIRGRTAAGLGGHQHYVREWCALHVTRRPPLYTTVVRRSLRRLVIALLIALMIRVFVPPSVPAATKALAVEPQPMLHPAAGMPQPIDMRASANANTWTSIGPGGAHITALVVDPATPTTLYIGTNDGVFKSADGGMTW